MSHRAGHLLCQLFVVLFLAFVDPAVLQQHELAGGDSHAIDPVGDHGNFTAQQLP
jgi:hypothetical protein